MTVKGGTTPACAACKYQRRKCSPTCPLAPYFPANQPKMFQNVHRLFGVSNVTKTLEKLNTKDLKEEAMKSIIYEAEIRERFPVGGCLAIIAQLQNQLHLALEELNCVRANLHACRDHYGVARQFSLSENGAVSCSERPLLTSDHCSNTMSMSMNMNSSLASIQAQMDALAIQNKNSFDFEAQQFNGSPIFDDGQIYNNQTKIEAFESSPDEEEHGCRRDMRTAAAGFSLTTVN